MSAEIQMLALRDNAKAELMQIKDIETGVNYLNKVKAIEVWVKAEKKDAELQNIIAEQKLRTQRILGQLIKEGQQKGELKSMTDGINQHGGHEGASSPKTLSNIGITPHKSSAFQAIADIPEETFEEFISEKKEAVNNAVAEMTTAGAVRLSKSLKEKKEDLDTVRDINARLDMEKELRDLARDLKKKYDSEQIELLIKFLTKLGVCSEKGMRLVDCPNVESYRMMLEDIYNWKRQKENKVSFRYE
jgi:hypothetical protein